MQRTGFYKRTRKGKVIRLIHEKYLRSDAGFGYISGKAVSASQFREIVGQAPHKHLLVIDTNVAFHQIDALEFTCPATSLVVVLQTVLQELQHLNLSVFRRLRNLLKDEKKSYIFFPNEACCETNALRNVGESVNDWKDRLIRTAVEYFNASLDGVGEAIMLSNDRASKSKCVECTAYTFREYVERYLHGFPELLDMLSADSSYMPESSSQQAIYPPHKTMEVISSGLKSKKFLRGTIRCKSDDWADCYVVVHAAEGEPRRSVNVRGYLNVNRACDGDVVAIELVPFDEAQNDLNTQSSSYDNKTSDIMTEAKVSEETAESTVEALESLVDSSEGSRSLYGRVIGIIRRNWRQYAGSLEKNGVEERVGEIITDMSEEESATLLFHPVERRVPPILITTRRREELMGCRLLVAIDSWPANSLHPLGHYVRLLGKDGEKEVETQVLLHEFDVPFEGFSTEVMACLPSSNWSITEDIVAKRSDLRHLPVVSIDPPGCKDIDDALHCIRLANGNLQIGVHIADVTYFCHPDTPLDKEAAHRSTSTYLVERRLDMLPGLLTTQLCSLRSKEDHLAFTVLWEMDDSANIISVDFCKSVIHSVASLTYDEAQAMLDEAPRSDPVSSSVKLLGKIARILRQGRIDMGALTLASTEVRFKLDSDTRNPTDVSMYALKEANALVEEFMLLANITVAKKILRHFPTLGVLRRHQPPSREQFAPLLSAAAAVGVKLDISTSKTLADSLDRAVRPGDPFFNKLLRILSTRCMMPAQYFCSGEIPKDQWHHYGLAAPVYTHFTSPIRRYADVVVHRLLAAAIGVIPLPAGNCDRSRQQELCTHMNRRHKAAQYAQRASTNLHTLLYFKTRPSIEPAYVLTVRGDGFSVLVPRFGIEGPIVFDVVQRRLNASRVDCVPESHSASLVKCLPSGKEEVVLSIQVFQQVTVAIKVRELVNGQRKLVMNLYHNGEELRADDDELLVPQRSLLDSVDDDSVDKPTGVRDNSTPEISLDKKRKTGKHQNGDCESSANAVLDRIVSTTNETCAKKARSITCVENVECQQVTTEGEIEENGSVIVATSPVGACQPPSKQLRLKSLARKPGKLRKLSPLRKHG